MSLSTLTPYLIVFVLIIIDVLCADTSSLRNYARVVNNTNPTAQKLDLQRTTSTTTAWPALGQRNRNPRPNTVNNNNNPIRRSWVRPTSASQQAQLTFIANEAQSSSGVRNNVQPNSVRNNQLNSFANTNRAQAKPSMSNTAQLNPSMNNRGLVNPPANNKPQPNPTLAQVNPSLDNNNDNKAQPALPKPSLGPQSNNGGSQPLPNDKSSPEQRDDDELREFSETLLTKDVNNAAKYVTINYQAQTTSRSERDEAPAPLLSINEQAYSIPSIEKLMLLYNNYFLESSVNEHYTGQEKIEEINLLDTITATPVMQHTRNFLISKGKLGKDPKEFKSLLREIWFNMYSRGEGRIGSSGFEHVFLAEIKKNQVSGLHNWLYFSDEEKKNEANYLGYMKKIDLGNKGAILKYHFKFHDIDKPVGSMFIGTSPELEIALYSTCFVLRADRICPLKLNGNKFIIRTFTYRYRGKNMIGSAFPEI